LGGALGKCICDCKSGLVSDGKQRGYEHFQILNLPMLLISGLQNWIFRAGWSQVHLGACRWSSSRAV
jgi:hypothetical protein